MAWTRQCSPPLPNQVNKTERVVAPLPHIPARTTRTTPPSPTMQTQSDDHTSAPTLTVGWGPWAFLNIGGAEGTSHTRWVPKWGPRAVTRRGLHTPPKRSWQGATMVHRGCPHTAVQHVQCHGAGGAQGEGKVHDGGVGGGALHTHSVREGGRWGGGERKQTEWAGCGFT
jgi:hypothetical protein